MFVLTFDVSVDDHVAVQIGHPLQDLPGVAPRHVFRQRSVRLQLVLNGALETKKRSNFFVVHFFYFKDDLTKIQRFNISMEKMNFILFH